MPIADTRLTIDLDAMAHNLGVLRDASGEAEVSAVVKADGYGLGIAPVGRRLRHEGVTSFFVARLSEGEALRAALQAQATIYVLDGMKDGEQSRFAAARLTPVLCTPAHVDAARTFDGALAVQVDTGMNRQGLSLEAAGRLAAETAMGARVGLVMSHLGSAANPGHPRNAEQLVRFGPARALFPAARASLAASAGVFLGEAYRFDLVRPGVSLYGGGPLERPDPRLQAVAILEAPLIDIRNVQTGALIGYGEGLAAPRDLRIGVIGAGYADGVLRAAKGRGCAVVGGVRRPLLMVNMDVLAIDLGEVDARLGDPVELLGPNALLDDQAAASGTVAHEWLVRLSARAERRLVGAV